ncbi:Alpha-2-HS-glycoprotein [Gossypium arboreum]|uniref:Alpha-2-HS-glycoprotein n=1 Tax=Gossypium arboreum TaxID=29729 RepID=A0A0B0N8N3_GOSAR|nr:Alpha-2-HS-glycoprotein [Gossypium arboreum]
MVFYEISFRCHVPDMALHEISYLCRYHILDMDLYGILSTKCHKYLYPKYF